MTYRRRTLASIRPLPPSPRRPVVIHPGALALLYLGTLGGVGFFTGLPAIVQLWAALGGLLLIAVKAAWDHDTATGSF